MANIRRPFVGGRAPAPDGLRRPNRSPSLSPPRYGVAAADSGASQADSSRASNEREADRAADAVLSGRGAGPIRAARSGGSEGEAVPHSAPAGAGEELAPAARKYFERRFGEDFGGIRVHAGAPAAASAAELGARAYTYGQDIVFGAGEYQPGTPGGRQLIAHELAHSVQQSRGGEARVQPKLKVGAGLKLDTRGFTTTKSGDVYSAPKALRTSSLLNEVFTSLLASPRVFELAGSTSSQVNSNLEAHMKARMGVVDFASKKKYGFGAGSGFKMNPDFWVVTPNDFRPRDDVDPLEAIKDINKHAGDPAHEYKLACFAATKLTMIGGAESSFLSEVSSSDPNDWIPGDWGYIKNVKFPAVGGRPGLEGENIIYVGKDLFWGHFKPGLEYHKLSDWMAEVNAFDPPTEAQLQPGRRFTKVGLS